MDVLPVEENTQPNISGEPPAIEPQTQEVASNVTTPKGSKIKKILLVITVAIGLIVALYIVGTQIVIPRNNPPPPPVEEQPAEPEEPVVNSPYPEIAEDKWENYINKQYEFSFKYPTNAKFTEQNPFSLDPSTYQVLFTRNNIEGTNEYNLIEGYLFKVIVNKSIVNTDIKTLAQEKGKLFHTTCPETAKITEPSKVVIDNFEAYSFTVENCDGDHKETFVNRENNIFEVAQTYKGDIGYKQFYKATVEQIEKSFSYTNQIAPSPVEEWEIYEGGFFTLKHPSFDKTCCKIQGPPDVDGKIASKIVVYADPETVETGDKLFNGFAIYMVDNVSAEGFASYIELQKAALVENYKIVVGKSPITTDKTVIIDGLEGVVLEGYAWWGDMIYLPYKDSTVFAIAKTEVNPGTFDNVFGEILATIDFADN